MTKELFFRNSVVGIWQEDEDGYFYELNFRVFHKIDDNQAFEYQYFNFFETRPSHRLEEILLRVKYRKRIWRKWLFLEIAPQVRLLEEDDWDSKPGIAFSIEGLFGKDVFYL